MPTFKLDPVQGRCTSQLNFPCDGYCICAPDPNNAKCGGNLLCATPGQLDWCIAQADRPKVKIAVECMCDLTSFRATHKIAEKVIRQIGSYASICTPVEKWAAFPPDWPEELEETLRQSGIKIVDCGDVPCDLCRC
ncbi:hypothetical protein [Pyrobaculum neutrophilum]|uniref:Uncharacterized protein n=1 Tax=Pyrobaculum neutrophilum (strain DSM 2338 / JCM 9278 / NBRC 100436 / V24Sta) TaxID=444157 RepID=B1YCJ9_PYRNV|nr:hypothetical protein [Pyrobaculum neutrophilum]ACB39512.1 hypothetical protein Tneu_0570 [Pyrobaculum neutrophilum V24Sta]